MFRALGADHIGHIVDIQLGRLRALLAARKITLQLTDAARAHLAQVGYDPAFGARPLKRAIQSELQDPLSMAILEGRIRDGGTVVVDADEDELTMRTA
jgi:ATP-dependent Clp protease ATP-binding subunit ClpB